MRQLFRKFKRVSASNSDHVFFFLRRYLAIFVVVYFILPPSHALAEQTDIDILWHVENRFRLFDYLGNHTPEKSAELLKQYSSPTGKLIDYAEMTKVSPFVIGAGKERKIDHGPWIEHKQQYLDEYAKMDRKMHRISFSLNTKLDGTCRWFLSGEAIKELPCKDSFSQNDIPSHFEITVEINGSKKIAKTEDVTEHRILAIGDSYASGEGNPDAPTIWSRAFDGSPHSLDFDYAHKYGALGVNAAWWDARCHRSFWSNQMMAALSLALSDGHRVITFMQYSCSGAEIFDGLLLPQSSPPGRRKDNEVDCDNSNRACSHEIYSQLSAASKNMCRDVSNEPLGLKEPGEPWTDSISDGNEVYGLSCQDAPKIDTVFISIGGNDVQFSDVIKWALIPAKTKSKSLLINGPFSYMRQKTTTCPSYDATKNMDKYGACDKPTSQQIALKYLPDFYKALGHALKIQLKLSNSTKVYITAYPDPLHDENGAVCDSTRKHGSDWRLNDVASVQAGWDGIFYYLPSLIKSRNWGLNLTSGEAAQVCSPVIRTLNDTMFNAASDQGWQFVNGHLADYSRHGWCAINKDNESVSAFIISGITRGKISGISPSSWLPYEPRGRWLRTINDALLTQWLDPEEYEGGNGGSFHPTAEGHYRTGMAIYSKMKAALAEGGIIKISVYDK